MRVTVLGRWSPYPPASDYAEEARAEAAKEFPRKVRAASEFDT